MFAFSLVVAVIFVVPSFALQNGVGRTPAMGWNSYNAFSCSTTEVQYRQAADFLVSLGLKDVGYEYMNLDCGWQGTQRNSTGGFTWNTTTIPSGIPALSDYVHGKGLKFGLYSDGGFFACDFVGGTAHYLGSLHFEEADARSFANWGADYLKYDNCYAVNETDFVDFDPPIQIKDHFVTMRDALNATGRPIVFSACEWGVQDPARWPGTTVANSWRMSNDNGPPPDWNNIIRIINQLVPIAGFAGPGGFNDLDMLEVGNVGMDSVEQQTQFAFWSAAKSPLLIGTDLSKISSTALGILMNTRIIALSQDALGESITFKRRYTDDRDVWAGPLEDGGVVAVVVNWQNTTRSVTLDLEDVGFTKASGVNLISGENVGVINGSYTTTLQGHGILVLKLTSTTPAPARTFTFYPAASPSNVLSGGASTRTVNSSVTLVGNVGMGGTLTFTGVDGGEDGGTKLISVEYVNGAVTFFNSDDCSNCRNAWWSVNGGEGVKAEMPISGQSWDILTSEGFLLSLDGFKPGANNNITVSNPGSWAPDIYRVGVETSN